MAKASEWPGLLTGWPHTLLLSMGRNTLVEGSVGGVVVVYGSVVV